jgi:hypothetical protein
MLLERQGWIHHFETATKAIATDDVSTAKQCELYKHKGIPLDRSLHYAMCMLGVDG